MKTFFFGEHLCWCPWSLALASSFLVLGLESVCPRKGCPWPWPRIFLCPWPWPRALGSRLHLWSRQYSHPRNFYRCSDNSLSTTLFFYGPLRCCSSRFSLYIQVTKNYARPGALLSSITRSQLKAFFIKLQHFLLF